MSKKPIVPEKVDPPPLTSLSNKSLQAMTRRHVKRAIEITVELMESADNDSVRLGAAKSIMNKVLPDLKSQDIKMDGAIIEVNVIKSTDKYSLESPPEAEGSTIKE